MLRVDSGRGGCAGRARAKEDVTLVARLRTIVTVLPRAGGNVSSARPEIASMSPDDPSGSIQKGNSPIRRWDGAMPILMSIAVLLMIATEIARHGLHAPRGDEDASDHIAMLLMYGQIPIMFWFVATRRQPAGRILSTLALQLALWVITFVSAVTLT